MGLSPSTLTSSAASNAAFLSEVLKASEPTPAAPTAPAEPAAPSAPPTESGAGPAGVGEGGSKGLSPSPADPAAPAVPAVPGAPADPAAPAAPAAPAEAAPAAPAAPLSDAELFGEVDLGDETLDPDPAQPAASAAPAADLTAEELNELKDLLGEDKDLNREQRRKLHDKIFLHHPKGRQYREAFKLVRDVEQKLGRQLGSPDQLISSFDAAAQMEEILGLLQSGPDGAKQVIEALSRSRTGQDFRWTPHLRNAALEWLQPEIESVRQNTLDQDLNERLNRYGREAAEAFRAKNQSLGNWYLTGLNVLHFERFGKNAPDLEDLTSGRWSDRDFLTGTGGGRQPQAAPRPPAQPSAQPPAAPADPEKERMRQELDRRNQEAFASSADAWGSRQDTVIQDYAARAIAPLKQLVTAGVITERVYQTELAAYSEALWNEIGAETSRIGQQALRAIRQNDRGRLDFLQKEFQQRAAAAVQKTRIQFLTPYRAQVESASARAREAQQRQVQAGAKVEVPAGGSPAAPAVTAKGPDGTVAGNASWLANLVR